MEKDIVGGQIGTVGKYDLAFVGGQLVLAVDVGQDFGSAGITIKVNADVVLDKIKEAIPGKIDDAVIDLIKSALKA